MVNFIIACLSKNSYKAGKVKLIYIDPPYNTGNDSFNYNDNFNHATWLTFMKNRLEVFNQAVFIAVKIYLIANTILGVFFSTGDDFFI
jgi:adenine specific DNA methylase Mod